MGALIAARDSGDRLSEEELTNLACTIYWTTRPRWPGCARTLG